MKQAIRGFSRVLIAFSIVFFFYVLSQHWASIPEAFFSWPVTISLLGGVLAYQITFGLTAYGNLLLLDEDKGLPTYWVVLSILFISQFAKYLPGNFAHHIGRASMLQQTGQQIKQVTFALVAEGVTALLVSSMLVLAYILFIGEIILSEDFNISMRGKIVIFAVFCIILSVGYMYWRQSDTKRGAVENHLVLPNFKKLIVVSFLFFLNFLIWGGIILSFVSVIEPETSHDFWFLTTTFALAWAVGFITPGAPGGVGVREAILITLITPVYGAQTALLVSIALRVVSTFGDLVGFAIGLVMRYYQKGTV